MPHIIRERGREDARPWHQRLEAAEQAPGHIRATHWSIPDPGAEAGTDDQTYPAFERTAAELESRIGFLLHRLNTPTTKGVLQP